jgi:hypothetical protein
VFSFSFSFSLSLSLSSLGFVVFVLFPEFPPDDGVEGLVSSLPFTTTVLTLVVSLSEEFFTLYVILYVPALDVFTLPEI